MRTIVALLIMGMCNVAHAAKVEWFVEASHTSALLQGKPFNNQEGGPQLDAITGGFTITMGGNERWALDLSHGRKEIDHGKTWPASTLAVRYYPGRKR